MSEKKEDEPGSNLFEVASQVKAVAAQMAETAKVMMRAAEEQKTVTAAYEKLRLAARACAEHAARAAEFSAQTRQILAGETTVQPTEPPVEMPDSGYDARRCEEALAAIARAELGIAQTQACMTDVPKLKAFLAAIRSDHDVIRQWLAEVSLDEPRHAGNARLMTKRLESTEAELRRMIADMSRLPQKMRNELLSATDRIQQIIDQVSQE